MLTQPRSRGFLFKTACFASLSDRPWLTFRRPGSPTARAPSFLARVAAACAYVRAVQSQLARSVYAAAGGSVLSGLVLLLFAELPPPLRGGCVLSGRVLLCFAEPTPPLRGGAAPPLRGGPSPPPHVAAEAQPSPDRTTAAEPKRDQEANATSAAAPQRKRGGGKELPTSKECPPRRRSQVVLDRG
jgi:hypothetical protein